MTVVNLSSPILARPPRSVPLSTRLVVLLGGPVAWLGWIFAGFGMFFALAFLGNADVTSWIYFRGPLGTAPGTVTAVEQTHASEGGSKHHSGTPIYRYDYKFTQSGTEYQGTSYRTGSGLQSGAAVMIEFPAGNPARSRIQGMRRAVFGADTLLVLIFPAIGFGLVAAIIYGGGRDLKLLINGETAMGRFTNKEYTNVRVNKRTVYKIWYEFTDTHGALQKTFTKSSTPEKFEGEAFQRLFYDPAKPEKCLLAAELPKGAAPDDRGQINECSGGTMFFTLLPVLVAAVFIATGVVVMCAMR